MTSERVSFFLIVAAVMGGFALVPLLARSWRMFFFLAVATALPVGLSWVGAFTADWDKSRMVGGIVSVVTTTGWAIGALGATIRLSGRRRGWRLAHFPFTEILVISIVIALIVSWLMIF